MGKHRIIHDNAIVDTTTGAKLVDFYDENDQYKFYAAVLMCGHCGAGYYIPILFPFACKNVEDVVTLARATARVKHDHKNYILCLGEIDTLQYRLLNLINDQDDYLKPATIGYDDRTVEERRILLPSTIETILENRQLSNSKRNKKLEISQIKTADMYPDYMVLQRTFGPRVESVKNVKIVKNGRTLNSTQVKFSQPHKVKLDDFLDDYLTSETYKFAIGKRVVSIASMYYQLYGENNPLGIQYKNGCICFVDNHGEYRKYEITDVMKHYLEDSTVGYKFKEGKPDPYEEILKLTEGVTSTESAVDKFNRKLKRKIQTVDEDQPGNG